MLLVLECFMDNNFESFLKSFPDDFFETRSVKSFFLLFSKTAFKRRPPEYVRLCAKIIEITKDPLTGEDVLLEDCSKPEIQNYFVFCDASTGKLYVFTEMCAEEENLKNYRDVEVLGNFDMSKFIRLEDKSGPIREEEIEREMSQLDLTYEEKMRVREQFCYPVFSTSAYRKRHNDGLRPHSTICDAISGQIYQITSLETFIQSPENPSHKFGGQVFRRLYLQKVVPIEDEYSCIGGCDVAEHMKWNKLSKEEQNTVWRARKEYIASRNTPPLKMPPLDTLFL